MYKNNETQFAVKIQPLSKVYQQSGNGGGCISVVISLQPSDFFNYPQWAQQGIKYPMISHGNKGMNKSTTSDFARLNELHLDVLMVLNEDNCHQLDN